MRKDIIFLVIFALFASGCAMKSYSHLGVSMSGENQLMGVVSKKSANEFDTLIFKFHDLAKNKQYAEAYKLFSDNLRSTVSLEKFIEDQESLDKQFGEEKDFVHFYYKVASLLPKIDEALFFDAFKYYNRVIGAYASKRDKQVAYEFGVVRINGSLAIDTISFGQCDKEC